jgi:type II secretory ATPase GspE/PulE/Tfp pilus assembly ATPase PilB-like protein
MSQDHFAVASALSLIVNQRLLRQLCEKCAGQGCEACLSTGYKGRIPVTEFVALDETLRARVREAGPGVIAAQPTLAEAGLDFVREKKTNEAEYQRLFGSA